MPPHQRCKFTSKFFSCFAGSTDDDGHDDSLLAPKGVVRVCVGKDDDEVCKLEMQANYLQHPLLEKLLLSSGEEYGFSYDGAVRILCEIDVFLYLLHLLNTNDASLHYMEGLSDLISKFHSANPRSVCMLPSK